MKNSLSKVLSLSADSGTEPNLIKSNSVQSGRSMIEMLGVLAIIGVLSVGGIAGYSKAMMKFKINKTADQIATIVANVRTLYGSQKKYTGLGSFPYDTNYTLIKKAHIAPDDMYDNTSSATITNAFGGNVYIASAGKNAYGDDKAFFIWLTELPEEACMELATMDWGSGSSSGLVAVSAGIYATSATVGCQGDVSGSEITACPNGSTVAVPMPVSYAAQACSGNSNRIVLKYY